MWLGILDPNSPGSMQGSVLSRRLGPSGRSLSPTFPTERMVACLESAMAVDIDYWFELELSRPRPLEGETEGGVRYSVTANLDGREFTKLLPWREYHRSRLSADRARGDSHSCS